MATQLQIARVKSTAEDAEDLAASLSRKLQELSVLASEMYGENIEAFILRDSFEIWFRTEDEMGGFNGPLLRMDNILEKTT